MKLPTTLPSVLLGLSLFGQAVLAHPLDGDSLTSALTGAVDSLTGDLASDSSTTSPAPATDASAEQASSGKAHKAHKAHKGHKGHKGHKHKKTPAKSSPTTSSPTNSSPTKSSTGDQERKKRRQGGIIDTTGISGAVHPRLEVRQMHSEQPNQFTLLVLAFQKWYLETDSPTSYHAIAGIHGVPLVNYNNVEQCSTCQSAYGYCNHDMVTFPGWHRSLMALFEQEFVAVAQEIANNWNSTGSGPTRAEMQSAASTFRFPYWDWAANPPNRGNNFPGVFSSSSITINGPNGQETIANPLYQYHFPSTADLVYPHFTTWPNTLRYPTSDVPSATSQDNLAVTAFNNIRPSLQDQVYRLLTSCNEYLPFSNDDANLASTGCSNSIEGIHNTIHTTSGGVPSAEGGTAGHMYYLTVAAFDPLFWFHHAMVDRLFAMWQTINPSAYGASQVAPHVTWTIANQSELNANTPLTPFYHSSGEFLTLNAVREWTQFGYTYPEFADSDGSKAAIASYVNKLYGPSATATAGSSKRTAAPEPVKKAALEVLEEQANVEKRQIFQLPQGAVSQNGSAYEYVANIVTPRYALGGSYYVFMFLGQPASEDPASWINDANLVGPMGVLAQEGMEDSTLLISGSVPLTRSLTAQLGSNALSQLTEELVGPYLQNLLQWRILGPSGQAVDPTSLNGFLVSVYSSTASVPQAAEELPQYSEYFPLPIATHGKSGGLLGNLGL